MIPSKLIYGLGLARTGLYFLESIPLLLVNRFIAHPDLPPPSNEDVNALWPHIERLHAREAKNIEDGVYPVSALEFESPFKHALSFFDVMADGLRVAWRMRKNKTKDFSGGAAESSEGSPDYYRRNFHFQTDGYFSKHSARRYDHQVEILFNGTAGAMRRLILPPLKQAAPAQGRFLEIACGAGSATRSVAATFPKAKITALDMSPEYLKVAQDNLSKFNNVDFLQGDATQLDFKDGTFDAVYSVYLLHEMPMEERRKVLQEAWRVLKPGGVLVFADSLQLDDEPELNWALLRFPRVYHEPFYKGYIENKMEDLVGEVTGQPTSVDHALFTKVVWALKQA